MKRILFIFILLNAFHFGFSQVNLNSLEYWFDADYVGKTIQSISAVQTESINQDIPTTGLNSGMHILNFRVKDENGLYSPIQSDFFFKMSEEITLPNQIQSYEYWFDDDIANKTIVDVTPGENLSLLTDISTSELNNGMHIFNFRTKDSNGLFSVIQSDFFYKISEELTLPNQIQSYEYWFDEDFDSKTSANMMSGEVVSLLTGISSSELNAGMHIFNIRFLDSNGLYSSVSSNFFYKLSESQSGINELVAYEYWFDEDFDSRTSANINPGETFLQLDLSAFSNILETGMHRFSIRFLDSHSNWSVIQTEFFFKTPIAPENNEMTQWRYWLDENFVEHTEVEIPTGSSELFIMESLDMTQVTKGEHTLNCQFKDIHGLWSVVISDTIEKISLPIADFTQFITANCDSTIVQFQNLSIDGDKYEWTFGDGEISSEENPEHTYFNAGDYVITLTIRDTLTGVDSTTSAIIQVNTHSMHMLEVSECEEYISPSGNYTWGASGMYQDTIPNSMGCDSILTIDLTIHGISETDIFAQACDEYVSPSGNYTWTESGDYTDTLTNINMCDSVITIHLDIHPSEYISLDLDACEAYTSPSGNYVWTESGTYVDTVSSAFTCDSIIEINLNMIEINTNLTVLDGTITSNDLISDYQWVDCDENYAPVVGAVDIDFTPTSSGNYAVILTQSDCVDTSACVQIIVDALADNKITELSIYPNPAKDNLRIEMKGLSRISIYDMSGKLILLKDTNEDFCRLDVSQWSSGIYTVVCNGQYGSENKQIIINTKNTNM